MLQSEKPFSSDMIQMRMSRDVFRSIFFGVLLKLSHLIVFMSALVFIFKTPEMIIRIHGSS